MLYISARCIQSSFNVYSNTHCHGLISSKPVVKQIILMFNTIQLGILFSMYIACHLVQTAHDNSLVSSYGGQGSDPHLPSTK